jgi:uncharacterized protein YccT (UPF0319 family)
MTQKLWKAIKEYIDAAIENHNSTHVEDSIRKRQFSEDVEKLLEVSGSHITTSDYENIFNQAHELDKEEFVEWLRKQYTITYF